MARRVRPLTDHDGPAVHLLCHPDGRCLLFAVGVDCALVQPVTPTELRPELELRVDGAREMYAEALERGFAAREPHPCAVARLLDKWRRLFPGAGQRARPL